MDDRHLARRQEPNDVDEETSRNDNRALVLDLGIEDLEEVVRRLPFELRAVLRGREFKTEVVRREKRLPRAIRERRGQWDS